MKYETPITQEEHDIAIELCNMLRMDTNDPSLKHLKILLDRQSI